MSCTTATSGHNFPGSGPGNDQSAAHYSIKIYTTMWSSQVIVGWHVGQRVKMNGMRSKRDWILTDDAGSLSGQKMKGVVTRWMTRGEQMLTWNAAARMINNTMQHKCSENYAPTCVASCHWGGRVLTSSRALMSNGDIVVW